MVYFVGGISMAYEDYKDLTDEERQRIIQRDIPKFIPTGEKVEITEERKKEAHEFLMRCIRLEERAKREKRNIPLTDEELYKED